MTTKNATPKTKNAVKAGTKGAAARKKTATPLGNTRAIDDNSFAAPKRKPKPEEKVYTLAEALAESGETIEELTAPREEDKPTRPAGRSNLPPPFARTGTTTPLLWPRTERRRRTAVTPWPPPS